MLVIKKGNIFKDIKLEIFNSIETFFLDLQKFDISFMPWREPINSFIMEGLDELDTF